MTGTRKKGTTAGRAVAPAGLSRGQFTLLLACVFLLGFRVLHPILMQSPTYDEGTKLGAAYSLTVDRYPYYDYENPPLYKLLFSVPLAFLKPSLPVPAANERLGTTNRFKHQFTFGDRFLFSNRVPARTLLLSGRLVSFAVYLLGGILLSVFVLRLAGRTAALLGALLYFTCPNLAASAAIATNDIFTVPAAILFLAALTAFFRTPNAGNSLLTGLALGLAVSAKYSLLVFGAAYAVVLVMLLARKRTAPANALLSALITAGTAAIVLEAAYLFIPPQSIYDIIASVLKKAGETGQMSYLMGSYSRTGFPLFFPVAFLLKTPIPAILLIAAAAFICFRRRLYRREEVLVALLVMSLFAAVSLMAKMNLGIRYVLPFYPMAFVFTAFVFAGREKSVIQAGPVLAGLLVLSNLLIHPYYQSYFNVLIGKNENGYRYLVDSSLDWGQDLRGLAEYLQKEGNPELMLTYFGTCNPRYYGLTCQHLAPIGLDSTGDAKLFEHINSDNPSKEYFAISATCLAGLDYPDHGWFSFLKDYAPKTVIGNTIFVYDITGRKDAYKKFAEIYLASNLLDHALRCGRRVAALDAQDEAGKICSAISHLQRKDVAAAERSLAGFDWQGIGASPDRGLLTQAAFLYAGLLIKHAAYDAALKRLDALAALNLGDLNYRIYNLRGLTFTKQGMLRRAEEAYRKSIALNPAQSVAYLNLGIVCEKMNDYTTAEQMYRTALSYNPSYTPAQIRLNTLLYARQFNISPDKLRGMERPGAQMPAGEDR